MTTASEQTVLTGSTAVPSDKAERDTIQGHLRQLIESHAFAGSRRSQAFLQYVVEETIAGRGQEIKERNIATDVFKKGADFNSQTESIVRVNAGEVRKRLKIAYESGLGDEFQIELPVGSYQPVFHGSFAIAQPALRPVEPTFFGEPTQKAGTWIQRLSVILFASVSCALAAWGVTHYRHPASPLDLLWQPFVHQTVPVLLALPSPTVFELIHRNKWPSFQQEGSLPASEIGEKGNYYVGVGAAFGAARFSEQLALRQQAFFLKFGSDVAFADLERSPAILLGGYSSMWTLEMTRTLRFRFERSPEWQIIVDSDHPEQRWRIPRMRNSSEASEGYALVSRVMNSESGHPILIAAGMTPNDTQAAAAFLTDARYFDMFAKTAGAGWSGKNFQVVLHNNVHGHSPGPPTIVASYVW
jgi:hypothetical protein